MKSHEGKFSTNFHDDKITKEVSHFISPLVVLVDSVFKMHRNCYPWIFLERM